MALGCRHPSRSARSVSLFRLRLATVLLLLLLLQTSLASTAGAFGPRSGSQGQPHGETSKSLALDHRRPSTGETMTPRARSRPRGLLTETPAGSSSTGTEQHSKATHSQDLAGLSSPSLTSKAEPVSRRSWERQGHGPGLGGFQVWSHGIGPGWYMSVWQSLYGTSHTACVNIQGAGSRDAPSAPPFFQNHTFQGTQPLAMRLAQPWDCPGSGGAAHRDVQGPESNNFHSWRDRERANAHEGLWQQDSSKNNASSTESTSKAPDNEGPADLAFAFASAPAPAGPLAGTQCTALQALLKALKPQNWVQAPNATSEGGNSRSSSSPSLLCSCSLPPALGIECDGEGMVSSLALLGAQGLVPNSISLLSHLTSLTLIAANFTNRHQKQLGLLTALQDITIAGGYAAQAHFQDLVWLSRLASLEALSISLAGFQGALPDRMSGLTNLSSLAIVGDSLDILPSWILGFTGLAELRVVGSQVYQEFPSGLGRLPHLRLLDLSANQFWGQLPSDLFASTSLRLLNLSSNSLQGAIPPVAPPSLQLLDLSWNLLTGSLPVSLFQLPHLQDVFLRGNAIVGPFPQEVTATAPSLRSFDLSSNNVQGGFPSILLELPALAMLGLSMNNFSGPVPVGIQNMSGLSVIGLDNNYFSGTLDQFAQMPWLRMLVLSNNSFTGIVPDAFSLLHNLKVVVVDGNGLDGSFPSVLTSLPNLLGISVARNRFSGTLPTIARWGGQFLDLSYNGFYGTLPSIRAPGTLSAISLAFNQFNGSIRSEDFCSVAGLEVLTLRGNNLTGPVPDLSLCRTLQALDLGHNQLSGFNWSAASSAAPLDFLDLSYNGLQGPLPDVVSQLANLTFLNLAGNKLGGTWPAVLGSLTNLQVLLLASNQLTGALPVGLCNLTALRVLSLSHNSFSEGVPLCLQSSAAWAVLDLSHNLLFGRFDGSFSTAPNALALNDNYLSGHLPLYGGGVPICQRSNSTVAESWGEFPLPVVSFSASASLARNCFTVADPGGCEGDFLTEVQRTTAECSAVCSSDGHTPMCGGNGNCSVLPSSTSAKVQFACQCNPGFSERVVNGSSTCILNSASSPGLQTSILVAVVLLSLILGLLVLLLVLYVCRRQRKRQRWSDLDVCQEFALQDIERATDHWSKDKFLGEGGYGLVYLGVSTKGEFWAVKRAKLLTNDFEKEVRAMASLHHPNLVRLLGFCLDYEASTARQEQILVYEFASKGDLKKLLEHERRHVSLSARLHIAIGAAEGLAYLHSFTTPIVHRDIKPGNILLDQDMRAKLADFGLLTKLSEDTATRVSGTPGYMDPEYMRSRQPSPRSDVYSFGVVLLELIRGRFAVTEEEHIVEQTRELFEQSRALDILDPFLEAPEAAVLEATLVAMDCVRIPGMARPNIGDVVGRLKGIQARFSGLLSGLTSCSTSGRQSEGSDAEDREAMVVGTQDVD